MIEIVKTPISDLVVLKPKVFGDERGYFYESYNAKQLAQAGIDHVFVQDNQSFSKFGTLRGLHFQKGEYAQTKLIRAVEGRILDVVVDLRRNSATRGQSYSIELSAENFLQLLVPKGFAHGFVVLSPTALVQYKCDAFYAPEHESGIHFADPDIKIDWQVPADRLIVSEKDKKNSSLREVLADV